MQTLKRIASGAIGALMAGSTMLSPVMAAGLEDFNTFTTANTLIVVGADAATADVVGGINIGAAVSRHGASGTSTGAGNTAAEGGEVSVTTSSDLLEIAEYVGSVREVLTGAQFDLLESFELSNDKGTTQANQYLRLENTTALTDATSGTVKFVENEDDVLADFLFYNDGDQLFEYQMDFEEGWESDESDETNNVLDDFEDETLVILGKAYNVVTARYTNSDAGVKLTLLAGSVQGTLAEGEKQTYTYGGQSYEIQAVFISNPNSGSARTILSVNGVNSKELADGETTTVGGVTLGVSNLLVNDRGGVVSFFIGADKLVLEDSNIADDTFEATVEINNENVDDATVRIKGTNATSSVELTEIRYRLNANAINGDVYVPAGGRVSEQLEEAEGMMHAGWDIEYRGLEDHGTSVLRFASAGNDDEYHLEFTTQEGVEYDFQLAESTGVATMDFADSGDRLHWSETDVQVATGGNNTWASNTTAIADDAFFVLTNGKGANPEGDDSSFTHVLQWTSISTSDKTLTFKDLATGTRQVTYQTTGIPGTVNATGYTDTLIVGGTSFRVFVENLASPTKIAVDLNGDGDVAGDEVDIVIQGGGILDMNTSDATGQATHDFTLRTLSENFDEASGNEAIGILMTAASSELTIATNQTLTTLDENDDLSRGLSTYGVLVELNSPSNEAPTLTFEYPLAQRGANVYVVGGLADAATGSGNVAFTELGASISKLDSQTTTADKTTKRLILVGGPAVNTLVAELGAAGKTPLLSEWRTDAYVGRAIVQYIESAWGQPAIIVAGYEAEDTTRAAQAIATTALTGMGVSWTGTTQSAYTYTPMAAEEEGAGEETA